MASFARMSDATKAQCYSMRFPSKSGEKGMGYGDIAKIVKKTDGTHPNEEAVRQAVKSFGQDMRSHRKLPWLCRGVLKFGSHVFPVALGRKPMALCITWALCFECLARVAGQVTFDAMA